jgi:hypothetical protein
VVLVDQCVGTPADGGVMGTMAWLGRPRARDGGTTFVGGGATGVGCGLVPAAGCGRRLWAAGGASGGLGAAVSGLQPRGGAATRRAAWGQRCGLVSHSLFARDLFFTLSLGLAYISNANPACSCAYVYKFQIRPIHPPLGDFQLVSEPGASLEPNRSK